MPELRFVEIKNDILTAESTVIVAGVKVELTAEWEINFSYVDEDGFPDPLPEDCKFTVCHGIKLKKSGTWHNELYESLRYELWASYKRHLEKLYEQDEEDYMPDLCPTNCGGEVVGIGGGVACNRCGYKERV